MQLNQSAFEKSAKNPLNKADSHNGGNIDLSLKGIRRLGPRTLMANLSRSDGRPLIHNPGDYVTLLHDSFCEKLEFSLPIASHPSKLEDSGTIDVLFYLDYGSILNDIIYTPSPGFNITLTGVHSGFDLSKQGRGNRYLCVAEGPAISFFSSLSPSLVRANGTHIVQFTPEKEELFFDNQFVRFASAADDFCYSKITHCNVGSGITYDIPEQFSAVVEEVKEGGASVQILIAGSRTFVASINSVLIEKDVKHFSIQTLICTDTQVFPTTMELSHDD